MILVMLLGKQINNAFLYLAINIEYQNLTFHLFFTHYKLELMVIQNRPRVLTAELYSSGVLKTCQTTILK
jgi:hypothetical protein